MSLHPTLKSNIIHEIDHISADLHDLRGAINTDDFEDISVHIRDILNAYETLNVSLNELLSHLSEKEI